MTVSVAAGAMEVDDVGEFQELRTMGVRLRRIRLDELKLETTAGTTLTIRTATGARILVDAAEPPDVGCSGT